MGKRPGKPGLSPRRRSRRTVWVGLAMIPILAGAAVFALQRGGRPWCIPSVSPQVALNTATFGEQPVLAEIPIPEAADWVDYGPVLEVGAAGEWDFMFAGATPGSVVKKDGLYYFYYVAADGYRAHDGDARHRSIGVATSPDGIRFEKYAGNPIVTHAPFDGEEEGANSAAITLDQEGNFVMFYGAAAGPADIIVADGRAAVSDDGFEFKDQGRVLDHCDITLYGFGDEVFPQAAFQEAGIWTVYYQPNGPFPAARTLGLASGPRLDHLPNSVGVMKAEDGIKPVGVWGNINRLSADKIAVFVQKGLWPETFVEVRTASPDTPHLLSESLSRIDIPNLKRGTAFLDRERRTWFMYYNDFSRYWYLKLAPAGELDLTPPTPPEQLQAEAVGADRIRLTWSSGRDDETGVVQYRVYRDGVLLGTTIALEYIDRDLSERQRFAYEIRAVNFHGVEGEAAIISGESGADREPPVLVSALLDDMGELLELTFDEAVERQRAEEMAHYEISAGVEILDARLDPAGRRVILTTTGHRPGMIYEVRVTGISDMAQNPNEIKTGQTAPLSGLIWEPAGCRLAF